MSMCKTLTAGDVARNPSLYDGSNGKSVRRLQVDGDPILWPRADLKDENTVRLSGGHGAEREIPAETPISIK